MRKKYTIKIIDVLGNEHVSIPMNDYPTNFRHIREKSDMFIDFFDAIGNVATTFLNTDHVVSVTIYETEVE